MNTGTEDGGGLTQVGDRCFFMVGAHVGHDCKVGSDVVVANNVLLAGHVSVGDHVVFGGATAVRQFVRIGEGAMLVGLSGIRADVIPWGIAQGPLANLIGLNVIGMRRHGFAKSDIQRYREAVRALFFARRRISRAARPRRRRLRQGRAGRQADRLHPRRKTPVHHGGQARSERRGRRGRMSARADCQPGNAAGADLRRRQPAAGHCGFGQRARTQGPAVPAARGGRCGGVFALPASLALSRPSQQVLYVRRAPPAAATSCLSDRWCARRFGISASISRR